MNNRIKLFALSLVALFILIAGMVLLSNLKPQEEVLPIPTPTPQALVPTPTSAPLYLEQKEALIARMPVSEPTFLIEYLYSSDTFIVTVIQSPFDANAKKAENWLRSHGVEDLSEIDIIYNRYRWVQ